MAKSSKQEQHHTAQSGSIDSIRIQRQKMDIKHMTALEKLYDDTKEKSSSKLQQPASATSLIKNSTKCLIIHTEIKLTRFVTSQMYEKLAQLVIS